MKIYIKILIFTILLFPVLIVGYILHTFFVQEPDTSNTPITFVITKGTGVASISSNLKKSGIIESDTLFKIYVLVFGLDKNFQPGDFYLTPGLNYKKLVEELTKVRISEKSFTIIEGWKLKDIADGLIKAGWINNEDELYKLTGRPAYDYRGKNIQLENSWDYDFLASKPKGANLEGYIYPDTYKVLEEEGVEVLLTKALDNFDKKLTTELRAEIEKRGESIYDILIIASILEKEVNTFNDRQIVSDIIRRRIKYNMPLQMDSTVNYFTNSGRARSTYGDLAVDSPWNTYKYAGLPLGTISNPSILSIRAAIYPKANNYLYFLTDKSGNVYFASTGAEHQANRKYLD